MKIRTQGTVRCGIVILITVLLAATCAASTGTYHYEIQAGDYLFDQSADGTLMQMKSFGYLMTPGEPQLPSRVFNIAVPPNCTVKEVTVVTADPVELKGSYRIAPARLGLPVNSAPELESQMRLQYQQKLSRAYA